MPDFSIFKEFNLFKITIGGNNKSQVGNGSVRGNFHTKIKALQNNKNFPKNINKLD